MAMKRTYESGTKTMTLEFTSISSFVEYIQTMPNNSCFEGHTLSSKKYDEPSKYGGWSGTRTYEEAIDYLTHGWKAESEKLSEKLRLAKKPQPTTSRRQVFQSVLGYTPIVPNYLMGIPNDMLNSKMKMVKQRVVTVNKDISYNCGYSEGRIEENSIKAFQIVQALEANGIRCNLNIVFSGDYGAHLVNRLMVKVRVKSSSEKLNISKTSFAMVNPGMLRRGIFRVIETLPEFTEEDSSKVRYGYGMATNADIIKREVEKQNQYYIARDIHSAETTAANLMK